MGKVLNLIRKNKQEPTDQEKTIQRIEEILELAKEGKVGCFIFAGINYEEEKVYSFFENVDLFERQFLQSFIEIDNANYRSKLYH